MLLSALSNGVEGIVQILMLLPIILFSLSLHESAHGFVAMKLGDYTASQEGRITLNPLKHLDPLGFLSMLLVGIGWARPVPVNVRNFKDPRKGMMLTGLAGPLSNFLLGLVATLLGALYNAIALNFTNVSTGVYAVLLTIDLFFYLTAYMNFSLAIFNLIPCPPFDGSRIFFYFLPKNWYFRVMRYERYIGIGVMVLILALGRLGLSPVPILTDGLFSFFFKSFYRLFTLIF